MRNYLHMHSCYSGCVEEEGASEEVFCLYTSRHLDAFDRCAYLLFFFAYLCLSTCVSSRPFTSALVSSCPLLILSPTYVFPSCPHIVSFFFVFTPPFRIASPLHAFLFSPSTIFAPLPTSLHLFEFSFSCL